MPGSVHALRGQDNRDRGAPVILSHPASSHALFNANQTPTASSTLLARAMTASDVAGAPVRPFRGPMVSMVPLRLTTVHYTFQDLIQPKQLMEPLSLVQRGSRCTCRNKSETMVLPFPARNLHCALHKAAYGATAKHLGDCRAPMGSCRSADPIRWDLVFVKDSCTPSS